MVSGGISSPWLANGQFLAVSLHGLFSTHEQIEREISGVCSSSCNDAILSDQGPTLTTSFTLVVSTEALSPNTLGVRALMDDLRDTIQFIAIWKGSILPFNFLFSLCFHCFSFLCLLFSAFFCGLFEHFLYSIFIYL